MGQFIGTAELTPLESNDGRNWRVDAPLSYVSSGGERIDVPVGFITDLASVPRPLWVFWPPEGLYSEPAVIHDAMYTQQKLTRVRADAILLEAMKDWGVPWYDRWPIYAGVRAGGWVAWAEHAKQNAANKITGS